MLAKKVKTVRGSPGISLRIWAGPDPGTTDINTANPYPAIFLGGFGMMATYWLTRSMRASEPVVDVTPTTLLARTAALCAVAPVPFACGCLALLRFVQLIPVSSPLHGPFSPSARVAVLVGQIVMPSLGGPLLGGTGTINQVNTAAMIPDFDGSVFSVTAANVTRLFPINLKEGKLVVDKRPRQ